MKGLDWIKVVSNIAFDDDLEHVPDAAFRTFIELVAVSAFDLSDGRVALGRAQKLCNTRYVQVALASLSQSGHIALDGDLIIIPNYEKYQQTRAEVEASREANRETVRAYRKLTKAPVIQQSKSKSKSKNNPPISPQGFDQFWMAYPRREGKGAAEKKFGAALKIASFDELMAGLNHQLPGMRAKIKAKERDFIPLPATWLNQKRWLDEVEDAEGGSRPVFTPAEESSIAAALEVYQTGDYAAAQEMVSDELWVQVMRRAS